MENSNCTKSDIFKTIQLDLSESNFWLKKIMFLNAGDNFKLGRTFCKLIHKSKNEFLFLINNKILLYKFY